MKAAVLRKPLDIQIEERKEPEVGSGDALIDVKATGICGTDLNSYRGFTERLHSAIVLGHEYAGQVTKIGNQVSNVKIGDRVLGRAGWRCGTCEFCRKGMPRLCKNGEVLAHTRDGSFAELIAVPARTLRILPDKVSFEEAQSLPPAASTLHGFCRTKMKLGDNVAILGAGHAGLLHTQYAKVAGAGKVIVTDVVESRLKLAKSLGADVTVNVREPDAMKTIKDLTGGVGPDVVIEATGTPIAVRQAVEMVKDEGTILIFGVAQQKVDGFDTWAVYHKELNIFGTQGSQEHDYEVASNLVYSGKVNLKPLITHVMSIEQTARAFEVVDKRLEDVIRMVVT